MFDIIIVGAGPAGLTAAIYGCRAGKRVLLLEGGSYGGQITLSPRVENYPGFSQISGSELADRLLSQTLSLGAETDFGQVTGIRVQASHFVLTLEDGGSVAGRSVILATGTQHRRLGLPGEESLNGAGISFCAVCDGAFFAGLPVAVVGGGSAALQDALLLASTAQPVHLIHRRSTFRAEACLVEQLRARSNVIFHTPAAIQALYGASALTGLLLADTETGAETRLDVSGLFVAIGQEPQNAPFADLARTDEAGYLLTDDALATSVPGLFAAGDCRAKTVRQLTTAVADGTIAAVSACAYLDSCAGH